MKFRIEDKLLSVYHVHLVLISLIVCISVMYYFNGPSWCEGLKYLYPIPITLESLHSGKGLDLMDLKPINTENVYGTKHNPLHVCSTKRLDILCVVKSSPQNIGRRLAIRESWGKLASKGTNKLIFSLGDTKLITLQNIIENEAERFSDILQFNFQDAYRNLTVKLINNVRWTSMFCSQAKFVAFIDDDIAINFRNLQNFLRNLSSSDTDLLYTGYVVYGHGISPSRDESKHNLSWDEYKYPCFPSYVSGAITITSGRTLKLFDAAIPYVKPFFVDDVYLGVVALKLGITLSPHNNHMFDHDGSRLHEYSNLISSNQGPTFSWEVYELTR
ncbi:hypothetical protein FSP39_021176 [Pinctada imbricata]|uniref:Hexosyltransferase n=1 Tax=Pinctada imbricata TaxID=66713 RepID=A0AA89C4V9_PINIB|nr:hypothetical protein FSP39_021176 [Pinctada imbricata]